jgi:hypothetical protein
VSIHDIVIVDRVGSGGSRLGTRKVGGARRQQAACSCPSCLLTISGFRVPRPEPDAYNRRRTAKCRKSRTPVLPPC